MCLTPSHQIKGKRLGLNKNFLFIFSPLGKRNRLKIKHKIVVVVVAIYILHQFVAGDRRYRH